MKILVLSDSHGVRRYMEEAIVRERPDQILHLEWKILVPIGLANLLLMTVCVVFGWHF